MELLKEKFGLTVSRKEKRKTFLKEEVEEEKRKTGKTLGVVHMLVCVCGGGGVVRGGKGKKKEISSISEEWWVKSLTEDF